MPINTLIAQGFPRSQMNLTEEQGNILRNNMLRQKLGSYEEDRNILREKMQMEKDQLEIQKQRENREQEQYLRKQMNEPWEDLATTIAGIDMASNYLTPENHDQFVSFANNQKGTNRFLKLPTIRELEEKAMSEGVKDSNSFRPWYEQYKQKALVSLKTQAALLKAKKDATEVYPPDSTVMRPGENPFQTPGRQKTEGNLSLDQLLAKKVQDGEMTLEEALEAKKKPDKEKEPTTPAAMKDFEMTNYGKEVPELRGTESYKKLRLQWIREQKEQSPYVDALNRQIVVTQQREGTSLRKEFETLPEVKNYTEMTRQYEIMDSALKESKTSKNLTAIDQALITIWNKMTDPISVVRESEFERTPQNAPLINRFTGAFEKLKKGGAGLTDSDREALVFMAGKFKAASERKYKSRLSEYRGYLTNYGLDPDKYLTPYGKEEKPAEPRGTKEPTVIRYNSSGERIP